LRASPPNPALLAEAEENLRAAAAQGHETLPSDPARAWAALASALALGGKPGPAIEALDRAVGIRERDAAAAPTPYRRGLERLGAAMALVNRGAFRLRDDDREAARAASGDFARAVGLMDETLREWPGSSGARGARATARWHLGNLEAALGNDPAPLWRGAEEDFGEAVRLRGESADALEGLARARLSLAGSEAGRGRDPGPLLRAAIGDLGRALRLAPDSPALHQARGNAWKALGEAQARGGEDPRPSLQEAAAQLGAALGLAPSAADLRVERGVALSVLGDAEAAAGADPRPSYRRALEDFGTAALASPGAPERWNDLGVALLRLAKAEAARGGPAGPLLSAALEASGKAARMAPRSWAVRMNLGLALEAAGRAEDAIAAWEEALASGGREAGFLKERIDRARAALPKPADAETIALDLDRAEAAERRRDLEMAAFFYGKAAGGAGRGAEAFSEELRSRLGKARVFLAKGCGRAWAAGPAGGPERKAWEAAAVDHLRAAFALGLREVEAWRRDADLSPLFASESFRRTVDGFGREGEGPGGE
ncbi:MAG: hypothetical protein MUC63_00980, partial [Planctomycetes bacterium]|nr:hypothetical protein [Planctomycetota bacterium]